MTIQNVKEWERTLRPCKCDECKTCRIEPGRPTCLYGLVPTNTYPQR